MAALLSSVAVILPSNHLLPSSLLPSELTTHGHKQPQLISMKISYYPWSRNLGLTCGTYHCGGNVDKCGGSKTIGTLKETRCLLEYSVRGPNPISNGGGDRHSVEH